MHGIHHRFYTSEMDVKNARTRPCFATTCPTFYQLSIIIITGWRTLAASHSPCKGSHILIGLGYSSCAPGAGARDVGPVVPRAGGGITRIEWQNFASGTITESTWRPYHQKEVC